MLPVENCGWMNREELHRYLARKDVLIVPHDTNNLAPGTDFMALELEDMPPLIQVHSRYIFCEKTNEPTFYCNSDCEGGHWQDALNKGARMGCIACSDDHDNNMGEEIAVEGDRTLYYHVDADAPVDTVTVVKNGSLTFPKSAEGTVSVFCLGPDAEGITLRGLHYPLENGTLTAGFPLGVSNHFTGKEAEITVNNGSLLVLWDRKNGFPKR